MTPPGVTVLPIEVWDQPGGAIVRCMCGTEVTRWRKGTVNKGMLRLRSSGQAAHDLSPDVTPAALLALIIHAGICERGQQVLAERQAAYARYRDPAITSS